MDREYDVSITGHLKGDTALIDADIQKLQNTPIELQVKGDLKSLTNQLKGLKTDLGIGKGITDGVKKASKDASNILKQSLGKNKKGEDVLFGDVVKNMNSQINALSTNIKGALSFKNIDGKQVVDGFKIAGLEDTIGKLKEIKSLSSSVGDIDTPKIDFSSQEKQLTNLNKGLKKTKSDIRSTVKEIQDIFPSDKNKAYTSADEMLKDFNNKSSRLRGDMEYYFKNRGETAEDFEKYNNGKKLNLDKLDSGENYFAQYLALNGNVKKLNTDEMPEKTWIDEITKDVSAQRSKIQVLQQQEAAQKNQIAIAEKSLELAKQQTSAIEKTTKATQEATKVDNQATQAVKQKNDAVEKDITPTVEKQKEPTPVEDESVKATKEKYGQIMRTMNEYNDLQNKLTKTQNADNGIGNKASEIQTYTDQMQDAEKRLQDLDAKSFIDSEDAKKNLNTKQLDAYNKSLAKRAQLEAQATDAENRRNLDSQKSNYSDQISQLESSLKNSGSLTDTIKQEVNGLKDSVNSLSSSDLKSVGDQFEQEFGKEVSRIENVASEARKKLDSDTKKAERDEFESKISSNVNNGTYDVKLSNMESELNKYAGQDSELLARASQQVDTYRNSLNDLKRHMDSDNPFELDAEGMDKALSDMNDSAKTYGNTMKVVGNEMSKNLDPNKATALGDKISKFYDNNTKAVRRYGDELKRLESQARNAQTVGEHAQVNTDFNTLASNIRQQGLSGNSFLGEISTVGKRITEYVGAYEVFQEGLQVVRDMGTAIKEVDDSMMNLKMATGVNNTEAQGLMSTYSDLGKELKATGTDVAASATEWLKQGKTTEEAETLASDSIILSKIGDLTSEDSTKYLTSAMKGYKVQSEDALSIVDKISNVDMASATDVAGLAEGMSRVATNADLAGVSMDKILGYLATVGEVTQKDMASVGKSFSTMFSRMGNIKLSRLKDYQNESQEDLSNVETVLRGQGIELRDGDQSFRNFGEVLDEVAGKWDGFAETGQRAIAQAFAGTNHMENFLVLMENYGKAMDYSAIATNSEGTALEKFSAYQDSLGGKLEGFKNQFQEFSTSMLDGGDLGRIVSFGTGALDIVTKLTDAFGLLGIAGGAFGIFQGSKGRGKIQFAV